MVVDVDTGEWRRAVDLAGLPVNQAAVRDLRDAVAAGRDRRWRVFLGLALPVWLLVVVLAREIPSTVVLVALTAAGAAACVVGLGLTLAGRPWTASRQQPLRQLDRAARRAVDRQVSGREPFDSRLQLVSEVLASAQWRLRSLIPTWCGLLVVQSVQFGAGGSTSVQVLRGVSAVFLLAGVVATGWQACRAARYIRRTSTVGQVIPADAGGRGQVSPGRAGWRRGRWRRPPRG